MAPALLLASAGNTAFFVIFGIFVVAMLALAVIVVVWAVRHDLAGREALARRQKSEVPARPPGPAGSGRRERRQSRFEGAPAPRWPRPRARCRVGRTPSPLRRPARPAPEPDRVRARRWRQPRCRPGGHARGAHPARHQGRPRLRRVGRRHQRRVVRRSPDAREHRAHGRHLARREGHRHLPPRPARWPVGVPAEAARPCMPTPGCGPSSRPGSTTRTSRTPPSRSRWSTTSLTDGRERWIGHGPAVEAILASSAIPSIFPPVTIDGDVLVDGGVVNNVPISRALAAGMRPHLRAAVRTAALPPAAAAPPGRGGPDRLLRGHPRPLRPRAGVAPAGRRGGRLQRGRRALGPVPRLLRHGDPDRGGTGRGGGRPRPLRRHLAGSGAGQDARAP